MSKSIRWTTQTAVFLALLVVLQFAAAQLGNQFITGSVVNLILIVSTVMCGFASAVAVACVAPVFIRLIGIGPAFWPLIPFIALGNLVLVAVWHVFGRFGWFGRNHKISYPLALVAAAVMKFAFLYVSVARFAAPILLNLPAESPVMYMYSIPQLITAAIGGALAIAALPLLKRAVKPPGSPGPERKTPAARRRRQ